MTSIGSYAFYDCRSLTAITLPEGVTSIGDDAFSYCSSLTAITLPESVTSIGDYAFYDCRSLTSITIPEVVTDIGGFAFSGCSSLTSITIPERVTSIGNGVFSGCTSLISIVVEEGNTKYDSREGCNAIIQKRINLLIAGCSVTIIPSSVTSIGAYAFNGCSGLTSVTLPEGVTSIGSHAFSDCSGLTSINIPESVTSIGAKAFYDCTGELIVNCNIPSALSITDAPFYHSDFYKITIGEKVTSIGAYAFNGCYNLTTINIPEGVTSIGDYAFYNCSSLTSITIPEVVTDIGANVFRDCRSLTFITIPASVTSIGVQAFYGCSNLTTITIPEGVKSLGQDVFRDCSSLTSITLPESVTSIGSDAFNSCSSLTTIVLPKNLKNIYSEAFANCSELLDVYIHAEKVPSTNTNAFNFSYPEYITLHVPDNALESYKTSIPWSSFGKIVALGAAITNVTLSQSSAILCENESMTLAITMTPSDADRNLITWSSSDPSVATVDNTGKVSAIAPGTATITAKANDGSGVSASCEVTVTPASYVITYLIDGEVFLTDTLIRGSAISLPDVPTKEGYTFSGWGEVPETMPAEDVTIKGTFTANKYLVTFKIGDEVIASDSLEYKSAIVAPEAPEKEGYTFSGWGEVADAVPAHDLTYEGSYSINSYTLTYVVDGETIKSDSVTYGTAITLPEASTKEGYTFSGWSKAPETMPAYDVTINGTFTINKYLVTFKIGDEVIASDSLEYGAAIVAPDTPAKEGYTFNGWGDVAETVPANDLTYEGSYTINSYLLAYTVDSEIVQSDSVMYGAEINVIAEPTKEGYTFSGWIGVPETMPAYDVTINGTFTINKYLVTFKIGDEVIASDSLEYGAAIVAPDAPAKEGYTFNGWGDVAETVPANDLTYEGSYTINSYLLAYTVDGEIVQSDSVMYGAEINVIAEPEKEGYTFSGWIGVPETMPAYDVTINGAFTINKYLVTFKIGDEVIASDSLEYGAAIVAPDAPEKEGYTFNGWGDVAETVPAGDVAYEGSYTVNVYNVYYYVGEELVHIAEVAYGEAIPEYMYEPTEEGCTFLGWVGESYDAMPAHDVTYTANIDNGIDQFIIDNSQLTIYDLTGRRVLNTENLKGGIYIVNGRKVIVK